MKRLFLSFLMMVFAVIAIWAKTYVVAAGVSAYSDSRNNLDYPAQDIINIGKVMKKAGCNVTVLTSKNATHDNILGAIRRIGKVAGSSDRIVFFFCGHGGEGFIVPYDGTTNTSKMLSYEELLNEINEVNAAQKVLFINSCHSGSAGSVVTSSAWQSKAKTNNVALFLSSDATEYSYESGLASAGFYSRSLLNCLHGLCDANGDKKITIKEIQEYLYNDVTKRSEGLQTPQLYYGGDMLNAVFMKF